MYLGRWLGSAKETVLISYDWDWFSFQRSVHYLKILLPPNLLKISVSIINSWNFHYWNCDQIRAHSKYCSEHVWKNFPVGMHPLGTHKAEKVIPLKVSLERQKRTDPRRWNFNSLKFRKSVRTRLLIYSQRMFILKSVRDPSTFFMRVLIFGNNRPAMFTRVSPWAISGHGTMEITPGYHTRDLYMC